MKFSIGDRGRVHARFPESSGRPSPATGFSPRKVRFAFLPTRAVRSLLNWKLAERDGNPSALEPRGPGRRQAVEAGSNFLKDNRRAHSRHPIHG